MISRHRGLTFFLLAVTALFGLSASFSLGYGLGAWQTNQTPFTDFFSKTGEDTAPAKDTLDTSLFWKVWKKVKTSYVDQPVNDETLFYGAVSGIAEAVNDPYTVYLNPEETASFNEMLSGEFEGIGAEIGQKDGQIVVIAPISGTPAEAAGLRTDDIIIKIDGRDTTDLTLDEAINLIRGQKGTTVTLTIYRAGDVDVREIAIVRDTIALKTVKYETFEREQKTIGVIDIAYVDRGSSEAVSAITHDLLLNPPDGLIIDLRYNPGGLLDESIAISSSFIEDGVIVQERYSDGKIKEYDALGVADLPTNPKVIVLINGGTASAAEIIAGALQDYDRAVIMGEKSFGKGSVQDYVALPDGSSLKITTARWMTPNGRLIEHEGIEPDITVEYTEEDYTAGNDSQLEAAIAELLKS